MACTSTAARSALDPITPPQFPSSERLDPEEFRLGRRELLVGERARRVQLGQPLELCRRVRGGGRRCGRGSRRGLRLLVALVLLRAALAGLVRDGRRRCACCDAHQRTAWSEHHAHLCLLVCFGQYEEQRGSSSSPTDEAASGGSSLGAYRPESSWSSGTRPSSRSSSVDLPCSLRPSSGRPSACRNTPVGWAARGSSQPRYSAVTRNANPTTNAMADAAKVSRPPS